MTSFEANKPAVDDCCENDMSNLDEKYTGRKLPIPLSVGPKQRKFTDIICCFVFLSMIVGMSLAIFWNYPKSKIKEMTQTRDSEGNVCGVSPKTKDYPFLYMVKFSSPYRSVCVKECPKFDYNQIRYNSDGSNTTDIKPVHFEDLTGAAKTAGTQSPKDAKSPTVTSMDDPNVFAYDPVAARGYYTASQYKKYLDRFVVNCRTNANVSMCSQSNEGLKFYDSRTAYFNICIPIAPTVLGQAGFLAETKASFLNDLRASFWLIVLSIIGALLMGCIFLLIATTWLGCLLWTQLILTVILLLLIGTLSLILAFYSGNPSLNQALEQAASYNDDVKARYQFFKDRLWILWVVGITFILFGFLLAVVLCKLRVGISTNLAVLQVAADYVTHNPSVLAVAIISFCLQVLTLTGTIWGLLVVHTAGDIVQDGTGRPIPVFSYDWKRYGLWILGCFTIYWTVLFWNNFADMVTSAKVIQDYYDTKVGTFRVLLEVLGFHLGTVAFASLILLPVSIIQLLFGWLYDLVTDDNPNPAQKMAAFVCCGLHKFYNKFFNRISDAGMAMAYLSSCNFCPSSKRHHYLIRRTADQVDKVSFIGTLFKISGVFAIGALNSWFFFWILNKTKFLSEQVQNPAVTMGAIWVTSLVIAALLMGAFSTACDAKLMCHLVQLDLGKEPKEQKMKDALPKPSRGDGYVTLQ